MTPSRFLLKLLRLPLLLLLIASLTLLMATLTSSVTLIIIAYLVLRTIGNLFCLDAILVVVNFLMNFIVAPSSPNLSPFPKILTSLWLLSPRYLCILFCLFVFLWVVKQIFLLILMRDIIRTVIRLYLVQTNWELKPTALFSWFSFSENYLKWCYLPISINFFASDILSTDGVDLIQAWNAMFNHLGHNDCLWNCVSEARDDYFITTLILE